MQLKKEEAKRLIDRLPDDATLDDLAHEIFVIGAIEQGSAESERDQVSEVREVRAKYGLPA